MTIQEATKQLSNAIQDSPEYKIFKQAKEAIDGDAAIAGLIKEYKKMQTSLQMRLFTGAGADNDEAQRFQQLSGLMFADPRTNAYLIAEMNVQKMMAGVFQSLTDAAGMDIPMPV